MRRRRWRRTRVAYVQPIYIRRGSDTGSRPAPARPSSDPVANADQLHCAIARPKPNVARTEKACERLPALQVPPTRRQNRRWTPALLRPGIVVERSDLPTVRPGDDDLEDPTYTAAGRLVTAWHGGRRPTIRQHRSCIKSGGKVGMILLGATVRWPLTWGNSAPSGTRTPNPLIKSQLLCQLS